MRSLKAWVVGGALIALIVFVVSAIAQSPTTAPAPLPTGVNIVVYQVYGQPVVLHLHGASGDVHIWFQPAPPIVVDQAELKKLEAIKKLTSPPEKK